MFSSPLTLIVGAGIPVSYGVYMLGAHYAYTASLPEGQVACGMAGLAAFGLILVVGPIGGIAGLIVGAMTTGLWTCIRHVLARGTEGN